MRRLRQVFFNFLFFSLFFSPLQALELKRVILSTNDDPFYIEFWPIVAPIWQAMGLRPTLALIADEDCPIDTSIGDVIRFDPIPNIPIALQAQAIRLLLPTYFPDEGCLISDIDMLPISRSYFFDGAEICPEDAFLVYRDRVFDYGYDYAFQRYPICYIAANGAVFASLFQNRCEYDFAEVLRQWAAKDYGWNTDEIILYASLMSWEHKGELVVRLGHGDQPRLDRGSWKSDFSSIDYSHYIDCHCPRPYSEYQESIDEVVAGIWKLLEISPNHGS